MKINLLLPLLVAGCAMALIGCTSDNDGRPIPGTVAATNTKWDSAQNNTPRTNPTPNPEPASNPPGPQSDRRVIISQ